MADLYPYRASDELAAALRAHREQFRRYAKAVTAHDEAHPGHELLWKRSAFDPQDDTTACGFRDGTDVVPDGLSRAKTRQELRPKKTKAGQWWQGVLDRVNHERPRVASVLTEYGVPLCVNAGAEGLSMRVAGTQWGDADVDGVLVYAFGPMTRPGPLGGEQPLSVHLTPIPLSEFYAIKERLDAERQGSVVTAPTSPAERAVKEDSLRRRVDHGEVGMEDVAVVLDTLDALREDRDPDDVWRRKWNRANGYLDEVA